MGSSAASLFAWLIAGLLCLSSAFQHHHSRHRQHLISPTQTRIPSYLTARLAMGLDSRNDCQETEGLNILGSSSESSLLSIPVGKHDARSTLTCGRGRPPTTTSSRIVVAPPSRRQMLQQTMFRAVVSSLFGSSVVLGSYSLPGNAAYIDPTMTPLKITDRVYLDVEWTAASVPASAVASLLSSGPAAATTTRIKQQGRIVIGLYGEAMPKTVENFVTLCRLNAYQGTTFYRIISDYSIQGGAIGDTSNSGMTGKSSFNDGASFEPDNFNIRHTQKGLVSMVKSKSGGVDSRFFIQLQDDAGWADDRYAAFGVVLDLLDGISSTTTSMAVVEALEKVPVQPPKNNPKEPVTIIATGVLSSSSSSSS